MDDEVWAIESLLASVRLEGSPVTSLRIMTGVTEEQSKRRSRS